MYIWWSLLTVKLWLLLLLVFTGIVCSIFFILIFLYCKIVLFTVCRFSVYLMAFDYQELKGLLTYLLTYLISWWVLVQYLCPAMCSDVVTWRCTRTSIGRCACGQSGAIDAWMFTLPAPRLSYWSTCTSARGPLERKAPSTPAPMTKQRSTLSKQHSTLFLQTAPMSTEFIVKFRFFWTLLPFLATIVLVSATMLPVLTTCPCVNLSLLEIIWYSDKNRQICYVWL